MICEKEDSCTRFISSLCQRFEVTPCNRFNQKTKGKFTCCLCGQEKDFAAMATLEETAACTKDFKPVGEVKTKMTCMDCFHKYTDPLPPGSIVVLDIPDKNKGSGSWYSRFIQEMIKPPKFPEFCERGHDVKEEVEEKFNHHMLTIHGRAIKHEIRKAFLAGHRVAYRELEFAWFDEDARKKCDEYMERD